MIYSALLIRYTCLVLLSGTYLVAANQAPPKVHKIEIRQMQFVPAMLEVQRGDTVIFTNKDIVVHDATARSGKAWKSPALVPGDSWRLVIDKSADYFCSFHPVMKGRIVVR